VEGIVIMTHILEADDDTDLLEGLRWYLEAETMCSAMASGLADQPERKQQAISSLVRASERLAHLVTDLLELAMLDLKELPIHLQQVELRGLLTTLPAYQRIEGVSGLGKCHLEPRKTLP
jgi:signal transduction histidine kinase